jgi:hypothetical protein
MCQTDKTSSSNAQDKTEMVAVGETRPINGLNGTSADHVQTTQQQQRNPYAPRYADFLSNISNFKIIEGSLRGMSAVCIFVIPSLMGLGAQKESNLQMHSLIRRRKLRLPRRWMPSESNTSNSLPPLHRNNPGWIVKLFASLDSEPRS